MFLKVKSRFVTKAQLRERFNTLTEELREMMQPQHQGKFPVCHGPKSSFQNDEVSEEDVRVLNPFEMKGNALAISPLTHNHPIPSFNLQMEIRKYEFGGEVEMYTPLRNAKTSFKVKHM